MQLSVGTIAECSHVKKMMDSFDKEKNSQVVLMTPQDLQWIMSGNQLKEINFSSNLSNIFIMCDNIQFENYDEIFKTKSIIAKLYGSNPESCQILCIKSTADEAEHHSEKIQTSLNARDQNSALSMDIFEPEFISINQKDSAILLRFQENALTEEDDGKVSHFLSSFSNALAELSYKFSNCILILFIGSAAESLHMQTIMSLILSTSSPFPLHVKLLYTFNVEELQNYRLSLNQHGNKLRGELYSNISIENLKFWDIQGRFLSLFPVLNEFDVIEILAKYTLKKFILATPADWSKNLTLLCSRNPELVDKLMRFVELRPINKNLISEQNFEADEPIHRDEINKNQPATNLGERNIRKRVETIKPDSMLNRIKSQIQKRPNIRSLTPRNSSKRTRL